MSRGERQTLVQPGASKAESRRLLMGKDERNHPAAQDTVGVEHQDRTVGFYAYHYSGSARAPTLLVPSVARITTDAMPSSRPSYRLRAIALEGR
jgi:hypothetical protein